MMKCEISKSLTQLLVSFYLLVVLILIFVTPFSQTEANILFSSQITLEGLITKAVYYFIDTPWAMRLPFFIISLANIYLYLELLDRYFRKYSPYYNLALLIFLLLPGVALSFIIVNYATIPIFLTLLILYAYHKEYFLILIVSMVLLLFTHSAQFIVYIGVALYSYHRKEWWLTITSVTFILIASIMSIYGIDGIPKGHLIQLVGIYAAIFSPILFLVVVYALYKVAIRGTKDLLWYIVVTAFVISLLLSIRQATKITDFAPFLVLSIPLVVVVFRDSLAIRLKEFRKFYYLICNIVIVVLLLETSVIFLHYPLSLLIPSNELLLDTSIYKIPQEIEALKKSGKVCKDEIARKDFNLYRYYGIAKCR